MWPYRNVSGPAAAAAYALRRRRHGGRGGRGGLLLRGKAAAAAAAHFRGCLQVCGGWPGDADGGEQAIGVEQPPDVGPGREVAEIVAEA